MTKDSLEVGIYPHAKLIKRNQVAIRLPIELDFDDESAKSNIYLTWEKRRNLPDSYPDLQRAIYKIRKLACFSGTLCSLSLVKNPRGTFVMLVFPEVRGNQDVTKMVMNALKENK